MYASCKGQLVEAACQVSTLLLPVLVDHASRLVTAAGEGVAATAGAYQAALHAAGRPGRVGLCVLWVLVTGGDPSVSSWGPVGLAWAADLLSCLDGAVHLIRLRPING
jgi:hypothetical protein